MELFVHRPDAEHPELAEVQLTVLVRTLLVTSDGEHGVWVEDVDEEIDLDATFEQAGIDPHHHVHVGPRRRVEVTVRFNGDNFDHRFGPAKTIGAVSRWVFGPRAANLSPEQQTAHVLAVPGADHFLEDGVHVGSLVPAGTGHLTLDLLPRSRFAG